MPHDCETCKYYGESWNSPACRNCGDQDHWEPAELLRDVPVVQAETGRDADLH